MTADFSLDIKLTTETLNNGGIIIYPTDTIWGLGCDATQDKAVRKLYKIKKRHQSKSMIILLDEISKLHLYLHEVPEIALSLIDKVETPLTIIYPGARNIAPSAIAPDGSVAIRIVKDPFCRQLCATFGKPMISTSANISGFPNPVVYREISNDILSKADYVVKYGRDEIKQINPSTIVRLKSNWEYEIIRS
jgi:L-threonylcarbamoyladenylate synthase